MRDDGLEINTHQSAEGPEPKMPQAGDGSAMSARQAGDAIAADLLLPDGSPEWEAIGFDVFCSRCGYNLRTLTRPKCTECGLDFAWPDVLDASAHANNFLFEHNWQTRPVSSLLATMWRSLRPRSFWADVSIHEHVNRPVLWMMIALAVLCFVIALHTMAFVAATVLRWALPPTAPGLVWGPLQPTPLQNAWWLVRHLDKIATAPFNMGPEYFWIHTSVFILVFASLFLLRMLWQTLARYRIRDEHVLRVTAYAALPSAWWSAGLQLVMAGALMMLPQGDSDLAVVMVIVIVILMIGSPFAVYLGAGLEHYLHLPRPRIVGMVAVLVGTLTMMVWLILLSVVGIIR